MQEPEAEQNDVNRRGVLQEDGVGGSGQLGGGDEQELGQDGSGTAARTFQRVQLLGSGAGTREIPGW